MSIRRRGRRSESASPEESNENQNKNNNFGAKFSTWSSEDEDDDDNAFCRDRQRRGSSFSISSLASRSSTLSRLFKLTDKKFEPRKKSVSSNSLGEDFSQIFPDFYVSKPTSISSPSTPLTRSSTFNRKSSKVFEHYPKSQNYPKFTFRRDSFDQNSSKVSSSTESLDEEIYVNNIEGNNSGKSVFQLFQLFLGWQPATSPK